MYTSDHDSTAKLLLVIPLLLILTAVALNWPEIQRYVRMERM